MRPVNRAAWLVLASCASAAQPSDPPIHAAAPPAPRASITSARLALPGGAYLDIMVDGSDATAHRQCQWLVDHPAPGIPPNGRIDHACAATQLSPLPLRTALLITDEVLDANTVAVDNLFQSGHPDVDATLTNLHGKRVTYQPMDDLPTCERVRRELAADEARQEADFKASEKARIDHELALVIPAEAEVCKRADEGEATCALKNGARPECEDGHLQRIECEEQRRRHKQLDAQRAMVERKTTQPTAAQPTQRCEGSRIAH